MAWFKTCQFQVTPEIDRALMVKGFLVLGGDRRTIGGRSVPALIGVAPAVIFGTQPHSDTSKHQLRSTWLKPKVEKDAGHPTLGWF
jgi:hypothetical protein